MRNGIRSNSSSSSVENRLRITSLAVISYVRAGITTEPTEPCPISNSSGPRSGGMTYEMRRRTDGTAARSFDHRCMRPRILILGGGTGGTLTANRLRKHYGDSAEITVIDRDDRHVYQPGLLFVPFGMANPARLVRSRRAQLHDGIEFRLAGVESIETAHNSVNLADGEAVPYDVLAIASGATLLPEETEGLTGEGWSERMFTFYTLEGAVALHDALRAFDRGRLVVNMIDLPVKCPVAPLEFCFLADWYFKQRGIREQVQIEYVTSLDGAFTKATCNRELSGLLAAKGIDVTTEFNTGQVDGAVGRLISWDDREVRFDLLVAIPLHGGSDFVGRSPGLGDDLGFVVVDRATLQATAARNVFALGDATNVPTSKAGSVAHFQGETLVGNIVRFLDGRELEPSFDGHTNCFIETGFHKALLIDFNYETEPLPGRFPEPRLGPLSLLRESRLNHLGKLAFEWMYWHVLLPGRPIPGVGAQMQLAGKDLDAITMERSVR
jgi:sulfide:quinone oxidoreductase